MPAIVRIYRTGNPHQWTVALACGHKQVLTNAEVKQRQLFVGKPVDCPQCQSERAGAGGVPSPEAERASEASPPQGGLRQQEGPQGRNGATTLLGGEGMEREGRECR
jgi:hypothetical protein